MRNLKLVNKLGDSEQKLWEKTTGCSEELVDRVIQTNDWCPHAVWEW